MKDDYANNSTPCCDQWCEYCEGVGSISYNPNLNPNAFPATATARCRHCDGTGSVEQVKVTRITTDDEGSTYQISGQWPREFTPEGAGGYGIHQVAV